MKNTVVRSYGFAEGARVSLVLGDITLEQVDAIVNAANSNLVHGGGVAGAIVRRGGKAIQEESYALAPVPVGGAVITSGGKLAAKHVIHAVGPRWGEGEERAKLALAVGASLRLASKHDLKSISMPAISTGIFGFPMKRAAGVILGEIKMVIESGEAPSLEEVRICLFDREAVEVFEGEWERALAIRN